jgi:hypothetical protein
MPQLPIYLTKRKGFINLSNPTIVASKSNNYVVTMTEKNLEVMVSERIWLDGKCLDLLADRNNYTPIMYIQMQQICNDQNKIMKCITELVDQLDFHIGGNQLGKFF